MAISKEMALMWRAIRKAWSSFSPNRRAALDKVKVHIYTKNKDGSTSKRYLNAWVCAACGETVTDREVDHILCVGRHPETDAEVVAACTKLFCDTSNLQVLCKNCHKAKSLQEKRDGKYKKTRRKKK